MMIDLWSKWSFSSTINIHQTGLEQCYGDIFEKIPPKMPTLAGNAVNTYVFVDANHAGQVIIQPSHTGILIFVLIAPITWLSWQHNKLETSSFGSEIVALWTARDLIFSLHSKFLAFLLRDWHMNFVISKPLSRMSASPKIYYQRNTTQSIIRQ